MNLYNFKKVKLTKNDLKKHPADILKKLGAVDKTRGVSFPTHVYMSKKDMETVKVNLRKAYKKENPYYRKKALDTAVGYAMLSFGANGALENVLMNGVALVDTDSLTKDFEQSATPKEITYRFTYVKKPTLVEIVKKVKFAVVNALKFQNNA